MNPFRHPPDDPRITAYALGELDDDERPAIEAAMQADPALRAMVDEIRATTAIMETALAHEAHAPVTSPAAPRQSSVETDAGRPALRRRGRIFAFPQFYYIASGLAVAGFAVIVALYRDTFDAREKLRIENLRTALAQRNAQTREGTITIQLTLTPPSGDTAATSTSETGAVAASGDSHLFPRENAFRGARQHPLSTFSADVGIASYTQLRRLIEGRQLPPADAVRIEELLNYFSYHYPAPPAASLPETSAPLAATLEVTEAPWAPTHRLVRIGLKGREVSPAERPAANLVFLIDVSRSMNAPNRLPLVKDSLRMLLGELRADDRVAIVTYAGNSGLALPSTPIARSQEIFAALDALTPDGTPNTAMGIYLAYDIAKANFFPDGMNRVILCTGGDLKIGPTSTTELLQLVAEKAKNNVFLSVLGFGMDNLQDPTFEALADKGNGHYGYIDSRREAQKLLVEEVTSALATIARDVRIQVEFNPAKVASYRLIGYDHRVPARDEPAGASDDAGEMGSGQTVTALYEIVPVEAEGEPGGRSASGATADEFRYQTKPVAAKLPDSVAGELLTVKLRYKEPAGGVSKKIEFPLVDRGGKFAAASADFHFAAAVAEFGMILRQSPYRGSASLRDVIAWAATAAASPADDPGGYRAEFIDLVRKTQSLME